MAVTLTVAVCPLQSIGEVTVAVTLIREREPTLCDALEVHPFASVTVTVYVPAARPVTLAVVAPPGAHA